MIHSKDPPPLRPPKPNNNNSSISNPAVADNKYFDCCSSNENLTVENQHVELQIEQDKVGQVDVVVGEGRDGSSAMDATASSSATAAENTEWYEYGCV